MEITRRQFLKGMAAAAASALVPYTVVAKEQFPKHIDRFGHAYMEIYQGQLPTKPADIKRYNMLARVDGIIFERMPAPYVGVQSSAPASAVMLDSGHATWFRLISNNGKFHYYGTVGVDGADLCMPICSVAEGGVFTLDRLAIEMPSQVGCPIEDYGRELSHLSKIPKTGKWLLPGG